MGNFYKLPFLIVIGFLIQSAAAQSTLISATGDGGFETGNTFALNGWTEVNGGSNTNRWWVGTGATPFAGNYCGYISNDNSGSNNNYNTTAAVVHFYRDVTFPATEPTITLSFMWKCNGESTFDYLKVFVVSTAITPALGTELITGQVGTTYNLQSGSWQTATVTIPCTVAGSTQRLVFSWKNDGSQVNNPGASIDNISLISATASSCSSLLGAGITVVPSLPYSSGSGTTCGSVNDITSSNAVSCGAGLYTDGEDKVWQFTPTSTGQITASVISTSTNVSLLLYQGCPIACNSTSVGTCIAYAQSSSGSQAVCATVSSGQTYYLVIDTKTSPGCNPYTDVTISAPGSGVTNDLPCNATVLSLGATTTGTNLCATDITGEPSAPACWSTGDLNTVWYSIVCPSSGQLRIITTLGTLTNTQIALYGGSCSALSYIACNDNNTACGSFTAYNSQLYVTSGLTAGSMYYISVDGNSGSTGTFDIVAMDGSQPVINAAGRECSSPSPVCNQAISVADPGYQTYGNICDFTITAGNCLASGEVNSVWYEIVINASGFLEFDIVPNDYPSNPNGSDYDFAIWKIAGSGAVTCSQIAAGSVNPFRCNYNFLGVTGLYSFGQSNPAYPGFDNAYETNISVVNGDKWLLVVSNFAGNVTGFTLNFPSSSPIDYSTPTQVIWSGSTNTSWTNTANWGSCTYPGCSIDAVIVSTSGNQPVLVSGMVNANSVDVQVGATLTLQAGANLNVCGDFSNYGTIVADPGSTITFVGAGVQNIYGALTGTNKVGNVVINKTSGSVVLNTSLEIDGNFTTSNNTSIFNTNGQHIYLKGNFTNASANTTFISSTASTLEFSGSANQSFNPGGSLTLYNVTINQAVPSTVTLTNNPMTISNTLTLTSGRIAAGAYEVNVTNTSAAAVNTGNANSYVDGNLRRSTSATGSYDFPVGNFASGKGYQRVNINFTSANTATNLLARFDSYASVPAALGSIECAVTYNLPGLDNGYWTITTTPTVSTGLYTATLYNTAGTYTNNAGAMGWTVMKKPSAGTWGLDGTCAASTINQVVRIGMSGFSEFGTGQSTQILPVELINFTGEVTDYGNLLKWSTASEFNNLYFAVEHSGDGNEFKEIGRMNGAGTSLVEHTYQYNDDHPLKGFNYYRLRQVNVDGSFSYSNIVVLENNYPSPVVASVFPNPAYSNLTIDLTTSGGGTAQIEIISLFGAVVYKGAKDILPGKSSIQLNIQELPRGMYFLRCSLADYGFVSMEKITLQ